MSLLAPSSPEFGKLKKVALEVMSQKEWSAPSLVALGGHLAADVNQLSGLSGSQKKQLVLDVIKVALHEAVEKAIDLSGSPLASAEHVKSLNFVVEHALPASLDLAVAAARGQLDLKKVKKSIFVGFLACLPSLVAPCGVSSAQAAMIAAQVEKIAEKVDPSLSDSQDTSSQKSETPEEKSVETETPPRKNSLAAGVVIRVPEATPQPQDQKSESVSV
jgi:hypothetical protein